MAKCESCIYKKKIAGDAHISCDCPFIRSLKEQGIDPIMITISQTRMISLAAQLGLTINKHGYQNGWCCFPINFDPIWLEGECRLHLTLKQYEDNLSACKEYTKELYKKLCGPA